jgi:hypothetical protein
MSANSTVSALRSSLRWTTGAAKACPHAWQKRAPTMTGVVHLGQHGESSTADIVVRYHTERYGEDRQSYDR